MTQRNFDLSHTQSISLPSYPRGNEATSAALPPPSGSGVASISFPSGSILAPSAPLERSDLAQALIDVLALLIGFSFVNLIAVSVPVSLFVLIFIGFG